MESKITVWELYGKNRNLGCIRIETGAIGIIKSLQSRMKPEELREELGEVGNTPAEAPQVETATLLDILQTVKEADLEEKGILPDPDFTGQVECSVYRAPADKTPENKFSARCAVRFSPKVRKGLDREDRDVLYGISLSLIRTKQSRVSYNFSDEIIKKSEKLAASFGVELADGDVVLAVCNSCRRKARAKTQAGEEGYEYLFERGISVAKLREIMAKRVGQTNYEDSLRAVEKPKLEQTTRYGKQGGDSYRRPPVDPTPPEIKKGAEEAIDFARLRNNMVALLHKAGYAKGKNPAKSRVVDLAAASNYSPTVVANHPEWFGADQDMYQKFILVAATTNTGQAVPVEETETPTS